MRYFLPIYPMLTLLAAWGLVAGWDLSFPGTADPEQFYFAK